MSGFMPTPTDNEQESKPEGRPSTSALLSKEGFFANGAKVDHGTHFHEFSVCEDHMHHRTKAPLEQGQSVTLADERMSKEAAYALYLAATRDSLPSLQFLNMAVSLVAALSLMDQANSDEDTDESEYVVDCSMQ